MVWLIDVFKYIYVVVFGLFLVDLMCILFRFDVINLRVIKFIIDYS